MSEMVARRMSRRRFLQAAGAASVAAASIGRARAAVPLGDVLDSYDDGSKAIPGGVEGDAERVIVVGAGFAGLAVANALESAGAECVVLEGRGRLGGRAWTADVGGSPVDLGCSWITDPVGNPMTKFATRSGVLQTNAAIELDVPTSRFYDDRTGAVDLPHTLLAAGHTVRFENEAPSISMALGQLASTKDGIGYYLDERGIAGDDRRRAEFFLRLVTEVPDATDWDLDSLAAWAGYSSPYVGVGQGNFPRGGYGRIVRSLGSGADVRLGHTVTRIALRPDGVRVDAVASGGNAASFEGSHAVVTAPLGVLKSGTIGFSPALPSAKAVAIGRLGFGTFEKVVMRFPEPYWATEHTDVFHLSHPVPMRFPLIVDYFHLEAVPVLVAFNVGSNAIELDTLGDAQVRSRMLDVLRTVRGRAVPDPTDVVVTRWGNDPFSRGSYSYVAVGATAADQRALAEPVGGRLLFAGEATSTARYGYADGALSTGIREAKRLLRQPTVRLRAHPSGFLAAASRT